MDSQTIIDAKNDVITKYGNWTAHNICLQDDVYTIAPRIVGDEVKLRRIVQCVFDLAGGSVEGLRILDLACLEGLYAIEFARHKASCLGIEGREANIEKARFARQVLGLDNLDFVQDDVRNLSMREIRALRRRLVSGPPLPSGRAGRLSVHREAQRGVSENLHRRHAHRAVADGAVPLSRQDLFRDGRAMNTARGIRSKRSSRSYGPRSTTTRTSGSVVRRSSTPSSHAGFTTVVRVQRPGGTSKTGRSHHRGRDQRREVPPSEHTSDGRQAWRRRARTGAA